MLSVSRRPVPIVNDVCVPGVLLGCRAIPLVMALWRQYFVASTMSNPPGKRQATGSSFSNVNSSANSFGPNIPTSVYPKDTIKDVAESLGIMNLRDNIAMALATDVEYRIRDIVQSASRYMKHSKRSKMTTSDVDNALRQKNIEVCSRFLMTATLWLLSAIHRRQETGCLVSKCTYAVKFSTLCYGR